MTVWADSRRTLGLVLTAGYLLGGALLLLWPWGSDVRHVHLEMWLWLNRHGWTLSLTADQSSYIFNGLLFVPAGIIATTTMGATVRLGALGGLMVSAFVEVVQASFLSRDPALADVICNASGATIGAWIGSLARKHGSGGAPVDPYRM